MQTGPHDRAQRAENFVLRKSLSVEPPVQGKGIQSPDRANAIDPHLSSLKILAQTLLSEIESIEKRDARLEENGLDLQSQVHRFEAELIRHALLKTNGRQRRAAKLLGMKVTTLNTKIRRYGLTANFRTPKTKTVAGEH